MAVPAPVAQAAEIDADIDVAVEAEGWSVIPDAEAVAIPRPVFDRLVGESDVFRSFVFRSFGRRLTEVIHLLEKVAFVPIESRLAAVLLERAGSGTRIEMSSLSRMGLAFRASESASPNCSTSMP